MSGGTFNLSWWHLDVFAEEVEEYLGRYGHELDQPTLERFKQLPDLSRKFAALVKAADYYAAGDYGPETFHEAWNETIKDLK